MCPNPEKPKKPSGVSWCSSQALLSSQWISTRKPDGDLFVP